VERRAAGKRIRELVLKVRRGIVAKAAAVFGAREVVQRVHDRAEGKKRNVVKSRIEGRDSNAFDRSEDMTKN